MVSFRVTGLYSSFSLEFANKEFPRGLPQTHCRPMHLLLHRLLVHVVLDFEECPLRQQLLVEKGRWASSLDVLATLMQRRQTDRNGIPDSPQEGREHPAWRAPVENGKNLERELDKRAMRNGEWGNCNLEGDDGFHQREGQNALCTEPILL